MFLHASLDNCCVFVGLLEAGDRRVDYWVRGFSRNAWVSVWGGRRLDQRVGGGYWTGLHVVVVWVRIKVTVVVGNSQNECMAGLISLRL